MSQAEKWRQAGLKSWETRRLNAAGQTQTLERPPEPAPPAPLPPAPPPTQTALKAPVAPVQPPSGGAQFAEWRPIEYADIPTRAEFVALTLALMREGYTNSDRMRDAIRRQRKLILTDPTGNWNECPSDKFVNEHAWALKYLIEQGAIELRGAKEYEFV